MVMNILFYIIIIYIYNIKKHKKYVFSLFFYVSL